jgi:Domain of unknown function (DUF4340)
MQKRNFLILAGATIVMVGLAILSLATGDRYVTAAAPGTRALPELAAALDQVSSVAIRRHGLALTFVRQGKSWFVADKGDYPAAAGRVRQIVLALADMDLIEPKTARPSLYPRLEVDDPQKGKSTLVTVKDKAGKTLAALIVGKERYDRLGTGNNAVYVRKPGEAQSWLASGSLDFAGDVPSWLERRIIDIAQQKIAEATLVQPDGTKLVISRQDKGGKFAVEGAPADTKFKSQATIGEPAAALEALDLDDVKRAAQLPVPATGVTTAAYRSFGGLEIDLRLFEHDKKNWIVVAASGSGKEAVAAKHLNARLAPWVFEIPSYKADLLRTRLAALIQPAKGS